MSITDELRECIATAVWQYENDVKTAHIPKDKLTAIADRIDAEHEADVSTACRLAAGLDDDALAKRGYIALPVDADGVPIHVGDEVAFLGRMTVDATDGHNVFFFADNWADGVYCVRADELRHYHAPTVEDVLREFAEKMNENMGMYTGEAIDADEWRDADRQTIAEYAAKLRLAGEAE